MKKIMLLVILSHGISLSGYSQAGNKTDSTKKFPDTLMLTKIEVEADFAGGKDEWLKYLQKHINYDIAAFNEAPRGIYKVKVKFMINKDGQVGNITALTHYGYGMESEVVRALKRSPDWKPATQNGQTVNAYRVQTVTFIVDN